MNSLVQIAIVPVADCIIAGAAGRAACRLVARLRTVLPGRPPPLGAALPAAARRAGRHLQPSTWTKPSARHITGILLRAANGLLCAATLYAASPDAKPSGFAAVNAATLGVAVFYLDGVVRFPGWLRRPLGRFTAAIHDGFPDRSIAEVAAAAAISIGGATILAATGTLTRSPLVAIPCCALAAVITFYLLTGHKPLSIQREHGRRDSDGE